MDHHCSTPPLEKEPPNSGEVGRIVTIVIESRSGLDSECHILSSTVARSLAVGWKPYHHQMVRVVNALDIISIIIILLCLMLG